MKKTSGYGGAPHRSKRAKLHDKGYVEMEFSSGRIGVTEAQAQEMVKNIHAKGIPAQVVHVNPFGNGGHWTVMYKKKKEQ